LTHLSPTVSSGSGRKGCDRGSGSRVRQQVQCRGSLSQFGAENQLLTSGRCAHRDHFAHRWGGSSERAEPSRAQTVPPYPPPHRISLPANGKISTLKTGKLCPATHADGAFLFAARRSRTPHPLAGCGAARTPSLPAQAEQRNRSLILAACRSSAQANLVGVSCLLLNAQPQLPYFQMPRNQQVLSKEST